MKYQQLSLQMNSLPGELLFPFLFFFFLEIFKNRKLHATEFYGSHGTQTIYLQAKLMIIDGGSGSIGESLHSEQQIIILVEELG